MVDRDTPGTPPSSPDGDGVRVITKARTGRRAAPFFLGAVVLGVMGVVAWKLMAPPPDNAVVAPVAAGPAAPVPTAAPARPPPSSRAAPTVEDAPTGDPNDLANYFRPGDPEPTGAELIGALNDVGIHTGIGAFNPPGTSPPLEGLAVPEDFELPEGYVRHYQSSDDGVAIEPILMYAPGFGLYDASGRPIEMPGNRVVPIDRAPPGLPVRWVRIPSP